MRREKLVRQAGVAAATATPAEEEEEALDGASCERERERERERCVVVGWEWDLLPRMVLCPATVTIIKLSSVIREKLSYE